ncbi:MAG: hypothetical protein C0504_10040 [Candidatus Solibacter sp.]|nr:hypothetical protein [Candidatus Solibacter sp.]
MPARSPLQIREADLLRPVSRFARRKGFRFQYAELPFFDYRIDLYGFSRPTGDTVAIELKLKDWRRAFDQALIYQLCSDYVYIAIPLSTALRVERGHLLAHGIGMIAVDPSMRCSILLDALRSSEVRDYYRQPYVELLERQPNERYKA